MPSKKLRMKSQKFIVTKVKSKNYKRGYRAKSGNCQTVMIILQRNENQAF